MEDSLLNISSQQEVSLFADYLLIMNIDKNNRRRGVLHKIIQSCVVCHRGALLGYD